MRSELQAMNLGRHQRGKLKYKSLAAELRGAVRGLRAASNASRGSPRLHVRRDGSLFCYSLVRAPPHREKTVPLLARQLATACDGWGFFSSAEDRELNIAKAYSHEDERRAIKHQMHEMVAAGVWRKLAEMGAIEKYTWILKVDADTFVRPSTLRRAFGDVSVRLGPERARRRVISVVDDDVDDGGTVVEGFFVALPTALGTALSKGPATRCDELLSGHNEEEDVPGFFESACLQSIHFDGFMSLTDRHGFAKVAYDQDNPDFHVGDPDRPWKYGPKHCEEIAKTLLRHFHRQGRHAHKPLCECTLGGRFGPTCVSQDFVAIHKVESAKMYKTLAKVFL